MVWQQKFKIRKSQFFDQLKCTAEFTFSRSHCQLPILHLVSSFVIFFPRISSIGIICPEMVLNRHWMEKFMFMSNNSLLIPKSTRYNFLSIGSEWVKNWVLIERQAILEIFPLDIVDHMNLFTNMYSIFEYCIFICMDTVCKNEAKMTKGELCDEK